MRSILMRFGACPVILLVLSATFAQAPQSRTPYVLMISTPSATVAVGSPVTIQVVVKNISQGDVNILKSRASTRGELTYDVAVVTAAGGPVPLTQYGRALHGQATTPPIMIQRRPYGETLKPNQSVVDTINLSRIYQLSPGSYIVQVSETESMKPGTKIASNALKLTIVP